MRLPDGNRFRFTVSAARYYSILHKREARLNPQISWLLWLHRYQRVRRTLCQLQNN
ncbi:hypothetical protein [Pectobacterium cacticida]|uniref:hypothetical protein n=1 Tax=Pectobacterium cacticida TaxID=69221 RepID=UPI002FEF79D9